MVIKKFLLSLCVLAMIVPTESNANYFDYFKSAPLFDPYDKTTQAQLVALFGLWGIIVGSLMAVREKDKEHPVRATIETIAGIVNMHMGVLMILFAGDIIDAKGALVKLIQEEFEKQVNNR